MKTKPIFYLFLIYLSNYGFSQVGIGTTNPAACAKLDVTSTSKGFLPPRMTSAQRNAIVTPAAGLTIYNTTSKAFEVYNGTNWYSTVHYVGENYGGGIVFYVYDKGQHGLIASTVNQSESAPWYNGTYSITQATNSGIGKGAENSAFIIAQQLANNPTGSFAAKLCAEYSVTVAGVVYNDWYLPSSKELDLLYLNRSVVIGLNGYFWSSTEYDSNNAYDRNFGPSTSVEITDKSSPDCVRAIRAF
jgi:hypothetical protein